MPKKSNTEEFILKAHNIHGDKYNYLNTNYSNSKINVVIICKIHGSFNQLPNVHLMGGGCPECGGKKKLNTNEFIEKAKLIHGNKYNYSLSVYKNTETPVKLICPKHNLFNITPHQHLSGKQGCKKCGNEKRFANQFKSQESILEKIKNIHGDKYIYDKVIYKGIDQHIILKCKIHGEFLITPHSIFNQKAGCKECGYIKLSKIFKLDQNDFIKKASLIHRNIYDYSRVVYKNTDKKVIIVCKKHGQFYQTPHSHLNGHGCSKCKQSNGEKEILFFLESKKIKYFYHKHLPGCIYKGKLFFDFYLPKLNICIEYDGIQHFKPIDYFGGLEQFNETIKKDLIKNDFCQKNNINLIRISYKENIIKKLKNEIKPC